MKTFRINSVPTELQSAIQRKIDNKTKPPGSLGTLENIALKIALIQQRLDPSLIEPHLLVFAADHGIASMGVSAYPQEVTWQMVMNFLGGGAAVSVFCRQNHIHLRVVDAGVNHSFDPHPALITNKAGNMTANFLDGPAMSSQQFALCLETGAEIVRSIHAKGCNVIGFGEMGIGNTSSAACLMSVLCNVPIEQCVGRGTGLDDSGLAHKKRVLSQAVAANTSINMEDIVARYGGFEIAQMVGGILQAAELNMLVLIDGFISTVALLAAQTIHPEVMDYCLVCHESAEYAHRHLLNYLGTTPLLSLGMRLGEGSGIAMAYPIVRSAVEFLNHMASFDSAGVSNRPA